MSKASDDDVAIIAETEADPEPEPEPEIESEPAAVENKDEEMAEVKDAENCEEVDADGEKKIEKEDQDMSDGGEDENDDVSSIMRKGKNIVQIVKHYCLLNRTTKRDHVSNSSVQVELLHCKCFWLPNCWNRAKRP